jgi:uncharacterized protein
MKVSFCRVIIALWVVAGAVLLGSAQSGNAQSWCRNASQTDEKLICKDAYLRELDYQLNAVFGRRYRELSGSAKATLDHEELGWLLARHRCGADYDCIARSYLQRIDTLSVSIRRGPR